jgi:GNAT superfamily N-acetyltransferase
MIGAVPIDMTEANHRSQIAAFEALIPHAGSAVGAARTFGAVRAVRTGVSDAFWNQVFVFFDEATEGDVARAVEWIASVDLPLSVQVRGDLTDRVTSVATRFGLEPNEWRTPGMGLSPIPAIPSPPAGFDVELVRPDTFDDWHAGQPWGEWFRQTFGRGLVRDPVVRLVTGRVGGEPVAAAAAILAGEIVGIYSVGTVERFRGRGFGTAVTWRSIQAGVDAGCTVAVLQSSRMGLDVYRSMGFVEVCDYVLYQARGG